MSLQLDIGLFLENVKGEIKNLMSGGDIGVVLVVPKNWSRNQKQQ